MKKLIICLLSLFVLFTSECFGTSLVDNYFSEDAFKFSDKQEGNLPYVFFSADRMLVDRDVNKSGIMISGKNINIDKKMQNNHFIISGDTVRINGNVETAIILAPKVIVNGTVKHLYTLTESLMILKDGNVLEDLFMLGDRLEVLGTINGSVIGSISNVTVDGNILNDLRIYTNYINIENASIGGKVLIKSYNDIVVPSKFTNNKVIKLERQEKKVNINIISLIITYIVVGLIYYLFNRKNNKIDNLVSDFKLNFNKIILSGSLFMMAMPLIVIFCINMLLIGINIVPTVLLVIYFSIFILGFSLASFFISLLINKKIFKKYENIYKSDFNKVVTIIVTSILISLTSYIPVIGGILLMTYAIISIGIIYINLFNKKSVKE